MKRTVKNPAKKGSISKATAKRAVQKIDMNPDALMIRAAENLRESRKTIVQQQQAIQAAYEDLQEIQSTGTRGNGALNYPALIAKEALAKLKPFVENKNDTA